MAILTELVDAEDRVLFWSEGADAVRCGLFQRTNGVPPFLGEAAELPLALQAKPLRVLQEQSFISVGGDTAIHVDVGIIRDSPFITRGSQGRDVSP